MPTRAASRLPDIVAELPVAVRAALVASAQKIAQDAKDRCPYDASKPGPHLRDEIHVEITEEGVEVIAGQQHGAFWGRFVEMGTTHSPPHPFLIPALEENRSQVIASIEAAIRQTVG